MKIESKLYTNLNLKREIINHFIEIVHKSVVKHIKGKFHNKL